MTTVKAETSADSTQQLHLCIIVHGQVFEHRVRLLAVLSDPRLASGAIPAT